MKKILENKNWKKNNFMQQTNEIPYEMTGTWFGGGHLNREAELLSTTVQNNVLKIISELKLIINRRIASVIKIHF